MAVLLVGGVAAAFTMHRKGRMRDPGDAGAGAGVGVSVVDGADAAHFANPTFIVGGVPQYVQPDSNQPARYDAANELAAASNRLSVDQHHYAQPELLAGPTDSAGVQVLDSDAYVADGFDAYQQALGQKASGNGVAPGSRSTVYAVPVAAEQRRASVLANATYGQASVDPTAPRLRSNTKHNASVYDGFGPATDQEEEC